MKKNRRTDTQTERPTQTILTPICNRVERDRQRNDRRADRQTKEQTDKKHKNGWTNIKGTDTEEGDMDTQTDRHRLIKLDTDGRTDRQTDGRTDKQTDGQTDKLADGQSELEPNERQICNTHKDLLCRTRETR